MIKKYKPTSPGRRNMTKMVGMSGQTSVLTKSEKKNLTVSLRGPVARSGGRISVQHQFSGTKKRYRVVDFKRNKYGIEGEVVAIEYDPNRTCELALVFYHDGDKRFVLAPIGLKVGDKIISDEKAEPKPGNAMRLANIPLGMAIHNIEMYPEAGGKYIRSAGTMATITAKEGKYVDVKMPSGEVRKFLANCYATIGQIGNEDWKLVKLGKAGTKHHMGVRPTTRGKTRAEGHPLAGKYKRRLGRHPVDMWGNKSKGKKTRSRKHTNKYIVKDRRKK